MGYVCMILIASCLVIYLAKGYVLSSAQLARFKNFWRPCDTYETGGYQVCNCFIAINNELIISEPAIIALIHKISERF